MKYWILASLFSLLAACQGESNIKQPVEELSPNERREALIQQNRARLKYEREGLEAYADSSGLDWKRSGTGLRIFVFEKGTGPAIQIEDIIEMDYTLSLLSGEIIRSSQKEGAFMMRVNKDNDAVLGLHEAALRLHRGDSAAILIPSHLGWGIAGNLNGVPPMSPVLYHVRIHE